MDHNDPALRAFLERANKGETLGSAEDHRVMAQVGDANRKRTALLNSTPLDRDEIRAAMSQIIGQDLDPGFVLFPPFTTDFGRNIHIGTGVFINSGARFQDQGGIFIGDGCFIGHNAVITTLNHELDPARRHLITPAPVRIERGAWLGANVTVLPGVTIGEDAVVAAGAVVTKDVPPRTVVGGVPAKKIREV